jgi:hypothetical protein
MCAGCLLSALLARALEFCMPVISPNNLYSVDVPLTASIWSASVHRFEE